jgi:hypothetical protein
MGAPGVSPAAMDSFTDENQSVEFEFLKKIEKLKIQNPKKLAFISKSNKSSGFDEIERLPLFSLKFEKLIFYQK